MTQPLDVAFCGGGSGGHLIPAIAVAQQILIREPHTKFLFLTSSRAVDQTVLNASLLPKRAWQQVRMPIQSSAGRMAYALKVGRSYVACLAAFRKCRPDLVVGLGGFASPPGVLAARTLNIPVVLLECNVVPGAANRILNRFCTTTCMGWPMLPYFRQQWRCAVKHTGVPIRRAPNASIQPSDVSATNSAQTSDRSLKTLLVLGGSQGATGVDDLVTAACEQLPTVLQGWRILHQTSAAHVATLTDFYQQRNINATVQAFISDVPASLSAADLVISRSGAVTLAEIADQGCAAILIPLASAADNHQAANAAVFAKAQAAFSIDSSGPDAVQELVQSLESLCASTHLRQQLAISVRRLATPTAAARVAEECLSAARAAAARQ